MLLDDGTTEQVSYLSVRQLDPVLNKPMECRAQWFKPYGRYRSSKKQQRFRKKIRGYHRDCRVRDA